MTKKLSLLAQLVVLYREKGVTSTAELSLITGRSARSVWRAKAEARAATDDTDIHDSPPVTSVSPPLSPVSVPLTPMTVCQRGSPSIKKSPPHTPSKEITPSPQILSSTLEQEVGGERDDCSFADGKITLGSKERADWLQRFEGDAERLELALIQVAAYVQPNSFRPLLVQVRSQLSRITADRRDRDKRYAAAAKTNSVTKPNGNWREEERQRGIEFLRLARGEIVQ